MAAVVVVADSVGIEQALLADTPSQASKASSSPLVMMPSPSATYPHPRAPKARPFAASDPRSSRRARGRPQGRPPRAPASADRHRVSADGAPLSRLLRRQRNGFCSLRSLLFQRAAVSLGNQAPALMRSGCIFAAVSPTDFVFHAGAAAVLRRRLLFPRSGTAPPLGALLRRW